MSNFSELVLSALAENGKTIKDLEENNILGKNTFYIFSKTAPSLKSLVKIANYLNLSIDYILERTSDNNFKQYKLSQTKFFDNLISLMKSSKISVSTLCKDLNMSRTNFSRWKQGTEPSLNKLIDISNYLNCNIDDLLEHE